MCNNIRFILLILVICFLNRNVLAFNIEELLMKNGINFLRDSKFVELLKESHANANKTIKSNNNQDYGYNDELCFEHLTHIVDGLQNMQMWALEFIDSWGKIPFGIMWLHTVSLGNFDECLNITHTIENNSTKSVNNVIRGQYCMANIPVNKILPSGNITNLVKKKPEARAFNPRDQSLGFMIGVCIPRSCNATMLNNELEKRLEMPLFDSTSKLLSEYTCSNNDPINLETIDIVAIIVFTSLGTIILLSSIYDYTMDVLKKEKRQLFLAFSVLTNGRKLFSMNSKPSPDVIPCLNGIRCLSIVWVVFGHTLMIVAFLANVNLKYIITEWAQNAYSMFVQSATVSVDSFFLLSGLLVAWHVLKELDRNNGRLNIILMYFHRYLRLTPLLAFVILFTVSIFRYTGSGPFWNSFVPMITPLCEKGWWRTLLYIQNYVEPDEMCLGHTWYLAIDMQLFVLSPLILIPLWKWGIKFGWTLLVLMMGSIAYVFVIYMEKEYTLLMKDNLVGSDRMKVIYYPTHARASPWLLGILLGYYLYLNKGKQIRVSKPLVLVGWFISLAVIFAIIFGPYHRTKPGSVATTLEGAFYESFSRISWAIALSWVIFACHKGYGGIINDFLSLPFWQPFSRLTYSIYITHMILESIVSGDMKSDTYFSSFTMMTRFYSDFSMTLVVSTVTVLAFESPIVVLEKLIFNRNGKKENTKFNCNKQITNDGAKVTISQEQLCNAPSDSNFENSNGQGKFNYIQNA